MEAVRKGRCHKVELWKSFRGEGYFRSVPGRGFSSYLQFPVSEIA